MDGKKRCRTSDCTLVDSCQKGLYGRSAESANQGSCISRTCGTHVERAVRLVENQYRSMLIDAQEITEVEIEPTSAASARMPRHSVWLLNRYGRHRGGAALFQRVTGSPQRCPILPLCAMVECLIPSDRKTGGALVVAKEAPRTFQSHVGRDELKKVTNIWWTMSWAMLYV